ncbi:MAG: HAD-IA family hydrolase [Deltaproteobacteria bacterium]|nr:HAD-IA family hydrolase [Deltaproteobacteria bacterium]
MNKVLIYDCDGVLGDTEKHGHLPAFNQMWQELGVPWEWSVEEYGRKLKIGGGKERMSSLFDEPEFLEVFTPPENEQARKELIALWHKRKSAIYKEIVNSGKIPPRPGVKRLAEEALKRGWKLAVASTSAQESVEAVLLRAMGAETAGRFALILAGDVVQAKKPAPDIYLMTADRLAVSPAECVVVEDSNNGLVAAVSADMKCVVTVSGYTREENFSTADIVLSCLGDPGGEACEVLANRSSAKPGQIFTVDDLECVLTPGTVAG